MEELVEAMLSDDIQLTNAIGRIKYAPDSFLDPNAHGTIIIPHFKDLVHFLVRAVKVWDDSYLHWRPATENDLAFLPGQYVWFNASLDVTLPRHRWCTKSVRWIPSHSSSFHTALVSFPTVPNTLTPEEKEAIKLKFQKTHYPISHGSATVVGRKNELVLVRMTTGLLAVMNYPPVFWWGENVASLLQPLLKVDDCLEVWVKPPCWDKCPLPLDKSWDVVLARIGSHMAKRINLAQGDQVSTSPNPGNNHKEEQIAISKSISHYVCPWIHDDAFKEAKVVSVGKKKLQVECGNSVSQVNKNHVFICGIETHGLNLTEYIKPGDIVAVSRDENDGVIVDAGPIKDCNCECGIRLLNEWCDERVNHAARKELMTKAAKRVKTTEDQCHKCTSTPTTSVSQLAIRSSEIGVVIKDMRDGGITLEYPNQSIKDLTSNDCFMAFLFGIPLVGLMLEEVFRIGQQVKVKEMKGGSIEIHLGNCRGSKVEKRLSAYAEKYDAKDHVMDALKERSSLFSVPERIENSSPNCITAAVSLLLEKKAAMISGNSKDGAECGRETGKLTSVSKKTGTVQIIGGSALTFSSKQVYIYSIPLGPLDMRLFLKCGLKVYAGIEKKKLTGVWVGSYRSVVSRKIIEEMRSTYQSVPEDALNYLEVQMWKLYYFLRGPDTSLNLSNEEATILCVGKRGGYVKGKNYSWNLSFSTETVRLFAIPLKGIEDLRLLLRKGQATHVKVSSGVCECVWIGKQRSIDEADIFSALSSYCQERKVPQGILHMLAVTLKGTDHHSILDSVPLAKAEATITKVDRHEGIFTCNSLHFTFASSQMVIYGYQLSSLDLRRFITVGLAVMFSLTDAGKVNKVWVGSLKKSRPNLVSWINENVEDLDTKHSLLRHWSFDNEQSLSQKTSVPPSTPEEISEAAMDYWAPIDELEEEENAESVVSEVETTVLVSPRTTGEKYSSAWTDLKSNLHLQLTDTLITSGLLNFSQCELAAQMADKFVREWARFASKKWNVVRREEMPELALVAEVEEYEQEEDENEEEEEEADQESYECLCVASPCVLESEVHHRDSLGRTACHAEKLALRQADGDHVLLPEEQQVDCNRDDSFSSLTSSTSAEYCDASNECKISRTHQIAKEVGCQTISTGQIMHLSLYIGE